MTRTLLTLIVAVLALLVALPVVGVAATSTSGYMVEHQVSHPTTVEAGEEFTIEGDVTNREDHSLFIKVTVDGESAFQRTVESGESVPFDHTMQLEETGDQDVAIELSVAGEHYATETATIEVTESDDDGGLFDVDLVEKIQEAVFAPFDALASAIIDVLTSVFASYPTVHPNDAVQEVYRLALITTFALSTLTVIVAGILFQIGPIFGVSYQQVRMILPRVLLALVFGTVSPFLLQYAVAFAEALTLAFKPDDPEFWSTIRLTGGLAVVSIINALLLVAVAALFIVRDFYILFAAAASPLIALGWALPYIRQYANSLIGTFWGFLLIGPLDMIVFRLITAMLKTPGTETPEWLTALGGFVMLLYLPFIVLSSGQGMAIFLGGILYQATSKPVNKGAQFVHQHASPDSDGDSQQPSNGRNQRRRGGSGISPDNKFGDLINEGEYQ